MIIKKHYSTKKFYTSKCIIFKMRIHALNTNEINKQYYQTKDDKSYVAKDNIDRLAFGYYVM